MGINLRYSPLEWDSKNELFDFSGAGITGMMTAALNTTGNVFYVSNVGKDNGFDAEGKQGKSYAKPLKSLDYAVGRCTANNGDVIVLMPGHNETVISAGDLDLDVAGITVLFMGKGESRAKITFSTVVGADMDVDAASITLINPKFVAGIDALTGPIDVNSTDFTMINAEYHDATNIETTDAVIATAGATRLKIDGYKYFKSNEGGTQKESHIQLNGVDDLILRNIHIEGDFDQGCLENITDECLRMTMENIFMKNTDPGNAPCMALDAACSGWARDVSLRNTDGTAVDTVAVINWSANCLAFGTDGYGGEPIGTADASSIEGKLDAMPICIAKTDGAVLNGNDNLFTITGGPVRAKITGIVTTIVGGAANGDLQIVTTTPAATVDLNAGPVAIDNDAAGTSYRNVGATSVFTPVTAGVVLIDPVTVEDTEFLLPIGTVHFRGSAAQTGVIAWYMTYVPLSPNSTVAAAA